MKMAGLCTPHFLSFFVPKKKRKRAVHGPKERKKAFGACGSFLLRLKSLGGCRCLDAWTFSSSRASAPSPHRAGHSFRLPSPSTSGTPAKPRGNRTPGRAFPFAPGTRYTAVGAAALGGLSPQPPALPTELLTKEVIFIKKREINPFLAIEAVEKTFVEKPLYSLRHTDFPIHRGTNDFSHI